MGKAKFGGVLDYPMNPSETLLCCDNALSRFFRSFTVYARLTSFSTVQPRSSCR